MKRRSQRWKQKSFYVSLSPLRRYPERWFARLLPAEVFLHPCRRCGDIGSSALHGSCRDHPRPNIRRHLWSPPPFPKTARQETIRGSAPLSRRLSERLSPRRRCIYKETSETTGTWSFEECCFKGSLSMFLIKIHKKLLNSGAKVLTCFFFIV